jgi:hypothetical protein
VFENRDPRRIFGPKRDKVTGIWKKLHSEELYHLYSSPDMRHMKSRKMRWAGHVARMGQESVSVQGRRPLGRPRRRWENGKRMDLVVTGWMEGVWSGFIWLRIGTGGVFL